MGCLSGYVSPEGSAVKSGPASSGKAARGKEGEERGRERGGVCTSGTAASGLGVPWFCIARLFSKVLTGVDGNE